MLEKLRQGFQEACLQSLARLYSLLQGFRTKICGRDYFTNPAWLAGEIDSLKGLDEFKRFLLAYEVAVRDPMALAANIKKFNLQNESLRCLLACEVAKRAPLHLKSHFDAFELQSPQLVKRVVKELIRAYPSGYRSVVKRLSSEDDRFELFCQVLEAFLKKEVRNLTASGISKKEYQIKLLKKLRRRPDLILETSFLDSLPHESLAQLLKELESIGRKTVKSVLLRLASTQSIVIADYIIKTSILTDDDKVEIADKVLKAQPWLITRFLKELKVSGEDHLTNLTIEALKRNPLLLPEVISLLNDTAKKTVVLALALVKPEETANYLSIVAALDEEFKTQLALTLAERCPYKLIEGIKNLQLSDQSKLRVAKHISNRNPDLVLSTIHIFEIQNPANRKDIAFHMLRLVRGRIVSDLVWGRKGSYLENFNLEEQDRLEILKELMKLEPHTVACSIDRFGISDHEIRVALAEELIEKCPRAVAINFRAFQIEDPSKRRELAAKIINYDINAFIEFIENFDLSDEALLDLAFRLIAQQRYFGAIPFILKTETLLGLFLEKVAFQENLSVFDLEFVLKETCKRLHKLVQKGPGLTPPRILERALKQSAAGYLADALELVVERDIYLVCAALCKYRLEVPSSNPDEKLGVALQKICWFTNVSDIQGLSPYTIKEIYKAFLNFARSFREQRLKFYIDPSCFASSQDRKRALRLLNIMVILKHLGAQEELSRTYFVDLSNLPEFVDPSNLPEIEAKLSKQLRDIFTEVFGLQAVEEIKVQQFLETWPDLLPLLTVVSRIDTKRCKLALVEAVQQLVKDPKGAWRYSPNHRKKQLPFSRKQVEAWKQNPSQLFFVEKSSSSKSRKKDLAEIESQVESLRKRLMECNFEPQPEASLGSSSTLEQIFKEGEPINNETIRKALSLFFKRWEQASSGQDQAALNDAYYAYEVISRIVEEVGKAKSEGQFILPKNLFQSLQNVKRTMKSFLGIDDDIFIFYQIITDDPYLLFTVGSLVDGVPSCLHYTSTSRPEALAAHLLDSNIKLIVTFYFELESISSENLRLRLLTGEAKCEFDPRHATLTINWGAEEERIDVTPVRRRIIRLGWSSDQKKSPKVLLERPYKQSFGDAVDQRIEDQEAELLERFCSGIAPGCLEWREMTIAATKNPGGVYTDTGQGLKLNKWIVQRTYAKRLLNVE
jgi:hypothetical protein